jgi:hypothetical protein
MGMASEQQRERETPQNVRHIEETLATATEAHARARRGP